MVNEIVLLIQIIMQKVKYFWRRELTQAEVFRLQQELSTIYKTQTAGAILGLLSTMYELKLNSFIYMKGKLDCSFVLYLLQITEQNPLEENLPFERLLNVDSADFPPITVIAPQEGYTAIVQYQGKNIGWKKLV